MRFASSKKQTIADPSTQETSSSTSFSAATPGRTSSAIISGQLGTTDVAVDGGTILGFATVTVGHLEIEKVPSSLRKKLPAYPLPILRLARLAVAQNAQRKGGETAH